MRKNERYYTASHLEEMINNIDEKLNNIGGDENVVGHSRILEIEDDFKGIDKKVKTIKRDNAKKFCIRNLKIFGRALQGICPYVVVAGIVFGGQTAIYDVPFVRQDQFKIAQHEQIINYNGVFDDKITYVVPSTRPSNGAYYSTQWEKKDDGKYYRTVRKYYIGNKTIDELSEMINNPDIKFEDFFERTPSTEYQVKTEEEITEKEKAEPKGYKIIYRFTDDEDIVLEIQDVGPNFGYSLLYIFFTILSFLPVAMWRDMESDFDFSGYVYSIREKNQSVNLSEIIELINEKKIKFEKVKREYITMEDPKTDSKTYKIIKILK